MTATVTPTPTGTAGPTFTPTATATATVAAVTPTATGTPGATPTVTPTAQPRNLELSHGFGSLRTLAAVGGTAVRDEFRISQEPYASYEVVVDSASGDLGPTLVLHRMSGTAVLQSSDPVSPVGSARSLRWINSTGAPVTGERIRVQSGSCWTDCGPDDVYRVRSYATTYAIPRFNNSTSQVTVVLLQNPADYPISGRIYFWGPGGALLYEHPFSAAPKSLMVLVTSTVPQLAGLGGTITVANDGRYGDLAGKAVAIEPATGFSFDSPLLPRSR